MAWEGLALELLKVIQLGLLIVAAPFYLQLQHPPDFASPDKRDLE